MFPPASERAEQTTRDVRTTPHVAPQPRGADGAARRPHLSNRSRPPWQGHRAAMSAARAAAPLLRMPVSFGYSFRPLLRGRGRLGEASLPSP